MTAVYNKMPKIWLGLLQLPRVRPISGTGPRSALQSTQFTTFYLFLRWIDTPLLVFNYVCIRADPVLGGSGDHE